VVLSPKQMVIVLASRICLFLGHLPPSLARDFNSE
jgi:hypothetical protein